MSTKSRKNIWRALISILLLSAIIGPWWFDRINVPAQYTCNRPSVRLEGDFCGLPMSGIWIPVFVGARFVELFTQMNAGERALAESITLILQTCLFLVLVLFLLLPLISPWLLILKGDRKRLHWLEMASLGIAALICGIWVIGTLTPQKSLALWGSWLYIGVAIGALILEVLVMVYSRKADIDNLAKANAS